MNKSAFLKLIQHVSNISDQQTEELEKVAATFPYCQTAHLLLAKSAYDKGSMLSTQRLRRASAYATNRQLLKRIIYTSPAPEPVFSAPAVVEYAAPVPETLSVQEVQEHLPEVEDTLSSTTVKEQVSSYEEDSTDEAATYVQLYPETEKEPIADGVTEAGFEQDEEYATDENTGESLEAEFTATADILEQPMEKLNSELALLLTINSLSPSFTDLLAQRADEEDTETEPLEVEGSSYPVHNKPLEDQPVADNTLAQLKEAESTALLQSTYTQEEYVASYVNEEQEELDEEAESKSFPGLEEDKKAAPEDATINYSFSDIDRMYAEDTLGYWMASSRMGEVLQLKEEDEVTRLQPQGFHPELILEYSKTHELEKPAEQATLSLHNQLNIIDQFLKLNPRLKTMSNFKLKPEPQEDLSLKSSKIRKGVASESLANIFIKQGKPKKAIKIYEQLVLKYPEKKSYFAEQIEKLQNLN